MTGSNCYPADGVVIPLKQIQLMLMMLAPWFCCIRPVTGLTATLLRVQRPRAGIVIPKKSPADADDARPVVDGVVIP